jgi:uncharacterized protein YdiU (UPF0061 family)
MLRRVVSFKRTLSIKRFYNAEVEEEKPKAIRPTYHPSVIPRRRHGMTVETFLTAIGKSCVDYKDTFETWEDLFTMKSEIMKLKDIPVTNRKWILRWVQRYRLGETPGVTVKNGDHSIKKFVPKKKRRKSVLRNVEREMELRKLKSEKKVKAKPGKNKDSK